MGGAELNEPALKLQTGFKVTSSSAYTVPSLVDVNTRPPAVAVAPDITACGRARRFAILPVVGSIEARLPLTSSAFAGTPPNQTAPLASVAGSAVAFVQPSMPPPYDRWVRALYVVGK